MSKSIFHSVVLNFINVYKCVDLFVINIFFEPIEAFMKNLFKSADIQIGTDRKGKWDIQLSGKCDGKQVLREILHKPSIGFGETYVDGLWDCDKLDELTYRMYKGGICKKQNGFLPNRIITYLKWNLFNLQTIEGAQEVGVKHYDLGNDLFESFIGPTLNYSCGYWRNAQNLDEAQTNKMKLIGDKLKLKPGMKVLDLGCGWGGLSKYLAQNYGVSVVGVTISEEGAKGSRLTCTGLPVEIRQVDYRLVNEKFDRIVAVEILEHLGQKNYDEFFSVTNRCLKDDGLFLLHVIGVNDPDVLLIDPWLSTYILPNWAFPSLNHLVKHTHGKFIIEDLQNIGHDMYLTMLAWFENFKNSWPKLEEKNQRGEKFYRLWTMYLLGGAGAFKARKYQVWHFLFSKNGLEGGYDSVR